MPRKTSVKLASCSFRTAADSITTFISEVSPSQSDEHISWLHNYAIIRLSREFEGLMLSTLIGAINNDTATLEETTGIEFPKHLTDEICEFLITGTGYFDFKGRSGLIKTIKSFVPDDHYLHTTIKKAAYRSALDRLSALRNFAAHESYPSKRAALEAIDGERISSSGAWLKRQERFDSLVTSLKALATEIENAAPF